MRKVNPMKIEKGMKVSDLVDSMKDMGFGAGKIAKASEIIKTMFDDSKCRVFFGVTGAMVPSGMKNVIIDVLERADVFVTTGANLTHDLVEALGENHYLVEGNKFDDEKLRKEGYDRMYNVLMKNDVYEKLEDFFEKNWEFLNKATNIKDFLFRIGELIPKGTNSILRKCFEKKIPIFCPALADSGIGLMIWGRKASGKKLSIDAFEDMNEIIDIAWTSKKNGVIYVGGGTPKNFIQQSLQFSKGADYGIQITTDRVETGGSSGAPLKEGISWGKMQAKANFIDVNCDATIALPLILASIK